MSAKRIVQPVIFDTLKNAVPGGLYDSALGPVDQQGRCVCVGRGFAGGPRAVGYRVLGHMPKQLRLTPDPKRPRAPRCGTCSLSYNMCPGHFGHIELPMPVYNPIIFQ